MAPSANFYILRGISKRVTACGFPHAQTVLIVASSWTLFKFEAYLSM
jgi:hypothetical protein